MLHFLIALALMQAPPAPAPDAGPTAAGFAAHLSRGLPREFPDFTLAAVRADGNLLVFTFDGRRGWRQRIPQEVMVRDTLQGLCSDGDFLTQIGASGVRVDRLEDGRDLQVGAETARCPQNPGG